MKLSTRSRFRRGGAVMAASALLAVFAGSGGAGALPQSGAGNPLTVKNGTVTDAGSASKTKVLSSRVAQSDPAVLNLSGTAATSVMVKLDYDPYATYQGDIAGLAATSPQVTHKKLDLASPAAHAYAGHIISVENAFESALKKAIPTAVVGSAYRTVYGGVAVKVPADQVKALLALPGAIAVQGDNLHQVDSTAVAPVADDDAQFIGANSAYSALGSNATAGSGVIVANVDTGAWPEHPSFAARPDLGTPPPTPGGTPRPCNFGTNPLTGVPFTCNNKLIGGQVFLNTYNANLHDELYPTSARDSGGHGTHTLSTAAGNPLSSVPLFGIDRGPIQGIAPGAFVMAYKALGPQGGFDSDLVAAINQAVTDGADVINYSVGPNSPQSAYTAPDDLAFLDAFDAGVVVSASAGNSGPTPGSVAHLGPWEITVGASTLQREFTSTATLTASGGATLKITGDTIMPGISTPKPVVLATSVQGEDSHCLTPAPAGSFAGKIVVCLRGVNGRVQKGFNVAQGGAAGMFLVNTVVQDVETDNHFLPAIHFNQPAGSQLLAFLANHSGVKATFPSGQKSVGHGDVMAAFSSRGPGGDFLKPDITAPGVQILAGNTPTPTDIASGPAGQYFQAIAGTSMSAPHITGSAALVLALHPTWDPAQVKSALMTTATRNVVKEDGTTPAGVFDLGAGRVDLSGVVDPGLTMDVTRADMDAVLLDPIHRIDLNEPSVYDAALPGRVTTTRTFVNTDAHPEVFKVTVSSDLAGAIKVTPSLFNAPPGRPVTLTITLDGTSGTAGTWYSGQIDLIQQAGTRHLHLPVAFDPSAAAAGAVSLTQSCEPTILHVSAPTHTTTCTAVAQNTALQPATVNLSTTLSNNLALQGATAGATTTGRNTETLPATTLAAAQAPDPKIGNGSSPAGFLDLAGFGIPLRAMGDETITNFTLSAPFDFAGQSWTSLGVVSDGYLIAGGGTGDDISALPQHFPDATPPNGVIAPLWTDLDGGAGSIAGEGFRIATLTDGVNTWLVVQYDVHVFAQPTKHESFQVWLGQNGTEDVSFTYRTVTDPGVAFNVGAENAQGSAGSNLGALPSPSQDLVVQSTPGAPGGSASLSVTLRPRYVLPNNAASTVETDMTTSINRDTAVARSTVQVLP